MRYRKRPVEVEAVQLTWQTWSEVCDLLGEPPWPEGMHGVYVRPDDTWVEPWTGAPGDMRIGLLIPTLEGTMLAVEGDYVIREPFPTADRQFYPCKPDIFEATYEPVSVDPRRSATEAHMVAWQEGRETHIGEDDD
jgi:hypothetical protein